MQPQRILLSIDVVEVLPLDDCSDLNTKNAFRFEINFPKQERKKKQKKKHAKANSSNHARLKTVIISIGSDYCYICVREFNITAQREMLLALNEIK
jgi:hypothetical protein